MFKLALVGINARFSHSNLAIKYLKESVKDIIDVDIYDFTINDETEKLVRVLFEKEYTHIGFSVYIWNVNETYKLINDLKAVSPNIRIILGGPEVSYDGYDLMDYNENIDYIVTGEGEESFRSLVIDLMANKYPSSNSVLFRDGESIKGSTQFAIVEDINNIPILYNNEKYINDNKYVYYEASRGCPFNCAFCLSSTTRGVRYKDKKIVFRELDTFLNKNVSLVKFIDRSFNSNPIQLEILDYIIKKDNGITTFHMELHPSLIKKDFLLKLKEARKDLFQFEVGLQTTNIKTAREIDRVGTYDEIKDVCKKLIDIGAHIHIDLIAGLPYEDLNSFSKSFDDLYDIRPDKIQLGFLKLLKGSDLRINRLKYDYKYFPKAPYEVISNKWLSYKDILILKTIEDLVEKFYNEGFFAKTLEYLIGVKSKSAWSFFKDFSTFWDNNKFLYKNISRIELYNILYDYTSQVFPQNLETISELLIYDYYKSGNRRSIKFKLVNYNEAIEPDIIRNLIRTNEVIIETKTIYKSTEILKHSIIERINGKYLMFIHENGLINELELKQEV